MSYTIGDLPVQQVRIGDIPVSQMRMGETVIWPSGPLPFSWTPTFRSGFGSGSWQDVIWVDGLDLFITTIGSGFNVTSVGSNEGGIYTSTNGTTWTEQITPLTTNSYNGIYYNPVTKLLVIGAGSSKNGDYGNIVTSTDTINWTPRTNPWTINNRYGVSGAAWSQSLDIYVAVGMSDNSLHGLASSTDAFTWTNRPYTGTQASRSFYKPVWSSTKNIFVTVGPTTYVQTSTNGTTWTERATPAPASIGSCYLKWNAKWNLFTLCTSNNYNNMISTDGITWTLKPDFNGIDLIQCLWVPELDLTVGIERTTYKVYTTPDASNWQWTERCQLGPNYIREFAYSPKLKMFVLGTNSGTGQYWTIT